jgi:hypothetical protein
MCALAFRRDGLALAAYSRLSGYVYVWTLQPAWVARMSSGTPPKLPVSSFLGGASAAAPARVVQLGPFRVVAAPPVVTGGVGADGVLPLDLSFTLEWAAEGGAVVLKHDRHTLGSIPVQCP